jgi:hypothetical protein
MANQHLTQLREDLEAVRSAKSALLSNGQEHTLNGSHSFKGISFSDLLKQEKRLENDIAALSGAKPLTLPDFNG